VKVSYSFYFTTHSPYSAPDLVEKDPGKEYFACLWLSC